MGTSSAVPKPAGPPLEVVRVEWGAAATEASVEAPRTKTETFADVSAPEPALPPQDPAAAELESGMTIAQIAQILGDPAYRTAGLAGRGYDEKALFVTKTGSRVVVFAANGIARDFLTMQAGEKSATNAQTILPSALAVVP
ncbi:MAG: hypothetical protein KDC27_00695 [Acidobacteria bacterium]|nr:hypothetical protein [Acidobacteriota bacterium]